MQRLAIKRQMLSASYLQLVPFNAPSNGPDPAPIRFAAAMIAFASVHLPLSAAVRAAPMAFDRTTCEHRAFLAPSSHWLYFADAPTTLPERAALMQASQAAPLDGGGLVLLPPPVSGRVPPVVPPWAGGFVVLVPPPPPRVWPVPPPPPRV